MFRRKRDDGDGRDGDSGGVSNTVTIVTTVTERNEADELFEDLVLYHLNGEEDFEEDIRRGLEQKLDAMLSR